MASLRGRFAVATAVLVGFQLAGALAAGWSGARVARVVEREGAVAAERDAVLAFGDAVREQYVHQAHTFIEGGPGHLDHYAPAAAAAEAALVRVEALALPGGDALRPAYTRFDGNFRDGVIPLASRNELDRAMAGGMHASSERLAAGVTTVTTELLGALDARQSALQEQARAATESAWWATVVFAIGSILVLVVVTRALAYAVLAPLARLQDAATRFGAGDAAARADVPRDVELRTVTEAFNRMVEQVSAAEERRVRTERLAALGEMSGAVAHELLNPLTTILGTTDDPTVREEAGHARRVVEGLLGFARPGREASAEVDLPAALAAAADRLALVADARDVSIVVSVPPTAPLPLAAPPTAVRQVLDNLLRNAIEASPAGATVALSLGEGVVEVADRGAGIPPAVRARLYEPFVTGRRDGTGLGLAVCQRVVTALGGALTHVDREGGGTVATWRLHA
ncbi:MAG: ATP-binding protein [Pseudomonadota bacterium]|nr:ATP-binding protein [Pseudomonadota bacterium]